MARIPTRREEIDIREEVDFVKIDPLFVERQRNRYASRGVALVVLLNGTAAIVLLATLAHLVGTENIKPYADAMLVFGVGAACGLASAFFAYLSRTFRLERPGLSNWRRPLRWLAVLAAIAGTVCFVGALNMARVSTLPKEPAKPSAVQTPAPDERTTPAPDERGPTQPQTNP